MNKTADVTPKILFIDDHCEDFLSELHNQFNKDNVFEQKTPNLTEILKIIKVHSPNVIFLDVMFNLDAKGYFCDAAQMGSYLLEQISNQMPTIPIIMLSETARTTDIQFPLAKGVIAKPDTNNDKFYKMLFETAKYWTEVANENWEKRWGIFIGKNPKMIEVARSIVKYCKYSEAKSVLVTGETGTGKEEICKIIHKEFGFSGSPHVIHCQKIDARDLRIQLGGFPPQPGVPGVVGVLGILEQLNWNSTLVFDEIDDLNFDSQNVLNRLLERQPFPQENNANTVFTPGTNCRFIITTQQDLATKVEQGTFRNDLWMRINVCNIHLPPLIERKDEIPQLYKHFINKLINNKYFDDTLRPDVEAKLKNHDYTGNIREFYKVLEEAINSTSNSPLKVDDIKFRKSVNNSSSRSDGNANITEEAYYNKIAAEIVDVENGEWQEKADKDGKCGDSTYTKFIKDFNTDEKKQAISSAIINKLKELGRLYGHKDIATYFWEKPSEQQLTKIRQHIKIKHSMQTNH